MIIIKTMVWHWAIRALLWSTPDNCHGQLQLIHALTMRAAEDAVADYVASRR